MIRRFVGWVPWANLFLSINVVQPGKFLLDKQLGLC